MDRYFYIHGVIDPYKDVFLDDIEKIALKNAWHFHTHGLSKKGLPELYTVMDPEVIEPKKIVSIINDIGDMMLNGEKFSAPGLHIIDDEETGKIYHAFALIPSLSFGEKALRIVLADEFFKIHNIASEANVPEIYKIQNWPSIDLLDCELYDNPNIYYNAFAKRILAIWKLDRILD